MKARVKFSKTGNLRFVGHLDLMRYFQRAIRRAQLPVAYSEGFSPHQILSFAAPLSVGLESLGEYFDMKLTEEAAEDFSSDSAAERLNREMAEGIRIHSFLRIPDDAKNCMSIVHAGDYQIRFEAENTGEGSFAGDAGERKAPEIWRNFSGEELSELETAVSSFLSREKIPAVKKGKNQTLREVDVRPMIFLMQMKPEGLFLRIAQGSEANLKPALLLDAFAVSEAAGKFLSGLRPRITRLELYDSSMRSLESYGEKF